MNSLHEPSNISYTNKDFNSIYVELLDYAKKISNRWDPSASEESDPGVVLLKLCALIADKNNYNIDKNILELMPSSVTNESSARQILDQCGYAMKHYESATGIVNVTLTHDIKSSETDTTDYSYILPMFTMFTDIEGSVVYASTEDAILLVGQTTPINVIEGVATHYTVNNDPLITLANLDNKNRLYFTELNVAENGIYITNVKSTNNSFRNYEDWYCVDNIETQPAGTRCYKFGVTTDGTLCYIEFPEDVELLFGEGINITYITTSGANGNIAADKLKSFYIDTKATKKANSNTSETVVDISDDDVTITNPLAIINGSDPETVEEGYKSYQRVKDTFNTLVSLKDYTDYMISTNCASNGYVCDRTTDICAAYKILQGSDLGSALKTLLTKQTNTVDVMIDKSVAKGTVEEPSMTAFDLRVYALNYQPNPTTLEQYNKSFELSDGSKYIDFLDKQSTAKSLQHEFLPLDEGKILMLKNKYPIITHIIPRYKLSVSEQYSVADNVRKALYLALNSRNMSFGEQAPYEFIVNTIESADERIKACSVSYPTYETYAVYKENNSIKELRIDDGSYGGYVEVPTYNITSGNSCYKLVNNVMTEVSDEEKANLQNGVVYYEYDETLNNLWQSFRSEIYAKSVLAGVTPLYTFDNTFARGVNQENTQVYENVKSIIAETTLIPSQSSAGSDTYTYTYGPLSVGENILLSAPSYIEENNYSSYVKFLFKLNDSSIPAKTKHELTSDEYIIIFWKASSDSTYYKYAKYSSNSDANVFSPSFTLDIEGNTHSDVPDKFADLSAGVHDLNDTELNNYVETKLNNKLTKYDILQGTQVITTYKINKIQINQPGEKGSKYIYWTLNNATNTLFTDTSGNDLNNNKNKTEFLTQTYTLRSGEYFYYTNNSKTMLYVLGEGTKITRIGKALYNSEGLINTVKLPQMVANKVPTEDIFLKGMDIIPWVTIPSAKATTDGKPKERSSVVLFTQEMQHQLIGEGCTLSISSSSSTLGNITSSLKTLTTDVTRIKYTDSSGNEVDVPIVDTKEPWSVESILNLNMSSTRAQKVLSHQSIKISYGTTSNATINSGSILSSEDVVLSGGANTLDAFDAKTNLRLLSYEEKEHESSSNIFYDNDNFTATIQLTPTLDDTTQTYTFETTLAFSLTKGQYLLRVTGDKELLTLNISDAKDEPTAIPLYTISPLLGSNNSLNKVYKLDIKSASTDVALKISGTTLYEDASLIVHPIHGYTSDVLSSHGDSFETSVLNKLDELDSKREADYTYTPTSYIAHPLDANMFLMKSHVYNPYTICQWSEKAADGSDIDVVNTAR